MAKGQVVRGTPVHHIGPAGTAHEGVGARTPHGFKGTQPEEYTSDERGYQAGRDHGTPYHSREGNGPEARRVVAQGTNVESSDHGNQNDPRTNGKGVVLDGANNPERAFSPPHARAMDSPVPEHAPEFDPSFIPHEDRAHLGSGIEHLGGASVNNDLRRLKGVMARGMDSTSHPNEDEQELTRDDTLRGPAAGTQKDVQGHSEKPIRE